MKRQVSEPGCQLPSPKPASAESYRHPPSGWAAAGALVTGTAMCWAGWQHQRFCNKTGVKGHRCDTHSPGQGTPVSCVSTQPQGPGPAALWAGAPVCIQEKDGKSLIPSPCTWSGHSRLSWDTEQLRFRSGWCVPSVHRQGEAGGLISMRCVAPGTGHVVLG